MIGRFLPGVPGPEIEAIFDMAAGNEIATGKFDSPESSGPRRQRLRLLFPAGVGIAGTQRSAGAIGWTAGGARLSSQAGAAHRLEVEHGPELPRDQPVEDVFLILTEVVNFMEGGGSFGFKTKLTKRNWHQLTEVCKVAGRTPRTLDEFRALQAAAQLEQDRGRFVARWRRLVEKLDGPSIESLESAPERTAQGYAREIRKRLEWRASVWEPLIDELGKVGFR